MKNEKGGGNMIQPLNLNKNITFKANEDAFKQFEQPQVAQQNAVEEQPKQDEVQISQNNNQNEEPVKKETFLDKINNVKIKGLNALKGVNNVTLTSGGVVRGVAEGALATAAVGVIGKNIKESKGQILGTTVGILKDAGNGLKKVLSFIPSLITKSPLENAKNLLTAPVKFYSNYLNVAGKMVKETAEGASEALKTHKATAAIATGVGLVVLGARTLQGKIKANKTNAELDHKVNHGHNK